MKIGDVVTVPRNKIPLFCAQNSLNEDELVTFVSAIGPEDAVELVAMQHRILVPDALKSSDVSPYQWMRFTNDEEAEIIRFGAVHTNQTNNEQEQYIDTLQKQVAENAQITALEGHAQKKKNVKKCKTFQWPTKGIEDKAIRVPIIRTSDKKCKSFTDGSFITKAEVVVTYNEEKFLVELPKDVPFWDYEREEKPKLLKLIVTDVNQLQAYVNYLDTGGEKIDKPNRIGGDFVACVPEGLRWRYACRMLQCRKTFNTATQRDRHEKEVEDGKPHFNFKDYFRELTKPKSAC